MSALGFVFPAAAVGSGALLVRQPRGIFPASGLQPLLATVTISENHRDELEITEHPVEQGAPIADHAFKRPAEVTLRIMWSMAPPTPGGSGSIVSQAVSLAGTLFPVAGIAAAALPTINAVQSLLTGNAPDQIKSVYNQLLALQVQRVPFTVLTGKRRYQNMLLKSLGVETDMTTENALAVVAVCREVIIVATQTVSSVPADASQQASPQITAPPINSGSLSCIPATSFTADNSSLLGAATATQSTISQTTAMLGGAQGAVTGLSAQLQTVVNNLSTTLGNLGPQIDSVVSTIPAPLEIPLQSTAQTLSVPVATGVSDDLTSAISTATLGINSAAPVLTNAISVLTSAESTLPASLNGLPELVKSLSTNSEALMNQFSRVIPE